ncbi:MAG: ABC transporter ATP-binding protein [Clostridium argentinense]|uniref:ABC transporter ATP-binding protein n=1 Tax=Clostridium butanoliproducens TaxID=2991837 RepID=UPI001DA62CD6|nr:ABC transporter ATP-binding protein [Clostridium butanoliproducens]MBS5825258.1 ABC transporter ATP-binding protein [Clostridium argentinense]MDU1350790.1 ABC transporter ATP-binding protein [Clostridium argentinense]
MKYYLFKYKKLFILSITFIAIKSILISVMSFTVKNLIDSCTYKNLNLVYKNSITMIIYILIIIISSYISNIQWMKFIKNVMTDLKNDIFKKLLSRPKEEFDINNTASYMSLINNDLEMLQSSYFMNLFSLFQIIISFISASLSIVILNIYIGVVAIVFSLLPILSPYIFSKKLSIYKKNYSDALSIFMEKSKDLFSGMSIIKSFNAQPQCYNIYKSKNIDVEKSRYKFHKVSLIVDLLSIIASYSAYFLTLALGIYLIIKDKITVGAFIGSFQLLNLISSPILAITIQISSFKSIKLVKKKVEDILNEENFLDNGKTLKHFENNIKFDNVSFMYDKRKVLDNVTFTFKKGGKYALVGKSGSGKSTLVKLLLKYYTNYEGNITIDNNNIKDLSFTSLYSNISIIQQDVFMFDASLKENITLFYDYNTDEIYNSIVKSGMKDFVDILPDKEESHIGENGNFISGGEKQRISIARSVIRNTPVLILDEATSSLDKETSYKIEKTLLDMKDLTIIFITHKLSEDLLNRCDEIIVMDDGKIVETGNYLQLLENHNYFYNLYNIN